MDARGAAFAGFDATVRVGLAAKSNPPEINRRVGYRRGLPTDATGRSETSAVNENKVAMKDVSWPTLRPPTLFEGDHHFIGVNKVEL